MSEPNLLQYLLKMNKPWIALAAAQIQTSILEPTSETYRQHYIGIFSINCRLPGCCRWIVPRRKNFGDIYVQ